MPWGDYGVSRKLRIQNNISPFGAGAVPVQQPLQQSGILESLRMLVNGATTTTLGGGTNVLDKLGPWNLLSQISLSPNSGTPILQSSGYGLYLINLLKSAEKASATPDTSLVLEANAGARSDVYSAPLATGTLRYPQQIPVTQRIRTLGGNQGFWPLQNTSAQLQFNFTPNVGGSASPFNIFSLVAGTSPYLTTGAATTTLTGPTVELAREFWEVPSDPADYPPFNLISSWYEDYPQTQSTITAQYIVPSMIGLLCRLGIFVYDSGTSNGVAAASLNVANGISLTTDADTPKINESSYDALARQADYFGFDMPQGFFAYDFLGQDLTLQDVIDTDTTATIKLKLNFSAAIGATSQIKIMRQIVSPLQVR